MNNNQNKKDMNCSASREQKACFMPRRSLQSIEEDLMTVISRMILHLEAGLVFARKAMAEIEETMTNGSSDDITDDAEEIATEEISNDDGNE